VFRNDDFLFIQMNIQPALLNHQHYKENKLKDRFLKHADISFLLHKLPKEFELTEVGQSVQHKSIHMVKWGKGSIKIMLWSQMHGNEATGTMALFDLINLLQKDALFFKSSQMAKEDLLNTVQLFMVPMVNPDGAEMHTRRNAQQIDINRDFLQEVAPESKILKGLRDQIRPHFGFNLHDQTTLWSVSQSLKPATLSFLAPAADIELQINEGRKKAMLVIADMFKQLNENLPGHIGLFDDEFEPRAFGDNFQKLGTSTILIEAGGYQKDYEKQEIRKYYFGAMLAGILSISQKSFEKQELKNYFAIPKNNKQIFHILIHDVILNSIKVSIGINYDEKVINGGLNTEKIYSIIDIGDLSFCDAYEKISAQNLNIYGEILMDEQANFKLMDKNKSILSFENGKMH